MNENFFKIILEEKAIKNTVPLTPNSSFTVKVYFEKECTAKIRSILEIDRTYEPCCSEGIELSDKLYEMSINGVVHSFYDVYQYLPCGTKCCYRQYNVNIVWDTIKLTWVHAISTPTTYNLNTCPPLSEYTDCLTDEPVPCVSEDCED